MLPAMIQSGVDMTVGLVPSGQEHREDLLRLTNIRFRCPLGLESL